MSPQARVASQLLFLAVSALGLVGCGTDGVTTAEPIATEHTAEQSEGSLSASVTIDGTTVAFGDPVPDDVIHYAFCIVQERYGYLGAELFAVGDDGGLADGALSLDLQPTDSADSDGVTHISVTFEEGPSYSYEGPLTFDLGAAGASGSLKLTSSAGGEADATFTIDC